MMEKHNSSTNDISEQNQNSLSDLPLDQTHLLIGDSIQLQIGNKCYFVTLIGYLRGQSVIVSMPEEKGNPVQPEKGKSAVVRFFGDRHPYAFDTSVSYVTIKPFSHLHLAYPKAIRALKERRYDRVKVNITGTANVPGGECIPCLIHEISTGGALISLNDQTGTVNGPLLLTLRVVINGTQYELGLDSEIRSVRVGDSASDNAPLILQGLTFNNLSEQDILALAAFDLLPDWNATSSN